jgi:hypothetical protein
LGNSSDAETALTIDSDLPTGGLRRSLRTSPLSAVHVFLMVWTFFGAFILPRMILPIWIAVIGLTFVGWIVFKGKCWLTKVEVGAKPNPGKPYQSSTLRTIAWTGIDVARHKNGITFFIDTWHYLCVLVAFYRLGHIESGVIFLLIWFGVNRGYRNIWNY